MAAVDKIGIVRFCEKPKDKDRIMHRLGLNNVQTESYLAILTKQSLLAESEGKYVITVNGQGYVSSHERIRKIKA